MFELIKNKGIFKSWDEKREEFIEEYGPIYEEKLISINWNKLEKETFRFIIDLASYS
jgi:hypothetical protein